MAVLDDVKAMVRSAAAVWVAAGIAAVGALGASWWLGWLSVPWLLAILTFAVAIGVFAGIYWGLPRLRERRFLQQEGATQVIGSGERPEEFRARFTGAVQALAALPQMKGRGDPVYALPWYLLIGHGGSGKTAAVRGSGLFTPLFTPAAEATPTVNYDWWVAKTALVLDTAGRYTTQSNVEQDRAEWYRLLMLLRQYRDRQPITGLVVAVGADWLATQPEDAVRAAASTVRDRIEEAIQKLGADFPVYVLVTRCDLIEGFGEFLAKLPPAMADQCVGYVDEQGATTPHDKGRGGPALQRLRDAMDAIYRRLHTARAALLDSNVPEALRPPIFCFPEEFRALAPAVVAFAEPLLNEAVKYHTPLFRGIFFASALQSPERVSLLRRHLGADPTPHRGVEARKPHFLTDLFAHTLPRDRNLVAVTPEAHRRRGLVRGMSVVIAAGICLAVAGVVGREYLIDRQIVASVDAGACPEDGGPATGSPPDLTRVERCRQAIEELAGQNAARSAWGKQWFARGADLEAALRTRYVSRFNSDVVEPLNAALERAFAEQKDPLPLMLLVARRVQLHRRCVSVSGCTDRQLAAVDSDHRTLLGLAADRRAPPDAETTLARTYAAYVLWQAPPREVLRGTLAGDEKRLQQWLSTRNFSLDTLLPLVNRQAPPLTLEAYWKLPAPITHDEPRVNAACTKATWDEVVAPFLQQLQDAVPSVAPALQAFREDYRRTCLSEWQAFLSAFPEGMARWRGAGQEATLAGQLLTPDSPFHRVIDDAVANLPPWLPARADPASGPQWTAALQQWAGSEDRRAYAAASIKVKAQLDKCRSGESCAELTQSVFAEGEPSAESTAPFNQAVWSAQQTEKDPAAAAVLTPLLVNPLALVWDVALHDVGTELQKHWTEQVVDPLRPLSPSAQLVQLYAPGGKLDAFIEAEVKPALGGKDPAELAQAGKRLPLAPGFETLRARRAELGPVLDGSGGPYPVTVEAGPTRFEAHRAFRGEQTVFSMTCANKAYRITNRPDDPAEATTVVPWSVQTCGPATITIYFYPGLGPISDEEKVTTRRLELSKSYDPGVGFLAFLDDFASGTHRFALDELSGDPESLRSGVQSVTVAYQVDAPPALGKVLAALREAPLPTDIVEP